MSANINGRLKAWIHNMEEQEIANDCKIALNILVTH